jgi:hypothetical protein
MRDIHRGYTPYLGQVHIPNLVFKAFLVVAFGISRMSPLGLLFLRKRFHSNLLVLAAE